MVSLVTLNLSSANAFNLVRSKILLFGIELRMVGDPRTYSNESQVASPYSTDF